VFETEGIRKTSTPRFIAGELISWINCYFYDERDVPLSTPNGYPWVPVKSHGYPWVPMAHGYPWVPMDTHRYQGYLCDLTTLIR
jgi:hypothetical protein